MVAGARCLREHPELAKLLVDGQVNLSNIAIAARSIKSNETKIEQIVGKSHRAVQMLVTPASELKPKERVNPIASGKQLIVFGQAERFFRGDTTLMTVRRASFTESESEK